MVNQYLCTFFRQKTNRCPSWISGGERGRHYFMTNLHERHCRTLRGSNLRPPDHQSDAHLTEPLNPALGFILKYHFCYVCNIMTMTWDMVDRIRNNDGFFVCFLFVCFSCHNILKTPKPLREKRPFGFFRRIIFQCAWSAHQPRLPLAKVSSCPAYVSECAVSPEPLLSHTL